jgi:hypothetical protein
MKKCYRCGEEKPLDQFYRHSKMTDGRLNKCADCCRVDARNNRRKRVKYYREYDRKRGYRGDPEKQWARHALKKAVDNGVIRKPLHCEKCLESGEVEGHHPDHQRPLFVWWVCKSCHAKIHTRESHE